MWNSCHSILPRPNPSLCYLLSDALEFLQQGKILTHQREEKIQRSSSWTQWNNTVKIPSLKWRWQSVYSNVYFVINQSQQTIIRLPWVSFFSGEVMQQFKKSLVLCWWDSPSIFLPDKKHFPSQLYWKSFTFSNYNTVITQHTNQYIQHGARSYTKQW